MNVSKKEFKLLIASDQVEEAIDQLFNLINLYVERHSDQDIGDIYDILVNNSAKYKGLVHDQNLGIIDSDEAKITKAEVNKGIMYVINGLPESVFLFAKELENEDLDISTKGKDLIFESKPEETYQKTSQQEKMTVELQGSKEAINTSQINQQTSSTFNHLPETNQSNKTKWIYISIGVALLIILLFIWQPWYAGEYEDDSEEGQINEPVTVEYNNFTDARDGKVYKTVKIGTQEWMVQNLAFKPENGYWPYNNDESNVQKYGYLYDWNTANVVCPEGWHLPTMTEFEQLINFLGGEKAAYKALIAKGISGFSVLFGGCRNNDGTFEGIGSYTNFWTSTNDKGKNAQSLGFYPENLDVQFEAEDRSIGFPVRCLHN
jgi:uncharacterized protein (TIGR02145 family)